MKITKCGQFTIEFLLIFVVSFLVFVVFVAMGFNFITSDDDRGYTRHMVLTADYLSNMIIMAKDSSSDFKTTLEVKEYVDMYDIKFDCGETDCVLYVEDTDTNDVYFKLIPRVIEIDGVLPNETVVVLVEDAYYLEKIDGEVYLNVV